MKTFSDRLKENTYSICIFITAANIGKYVLEYFGREINKDCMFLFKFNELGGCFLGIVIASIIGYIFERSRK